MSVTERGVTMLNVCKNNKGLLCVCWSVIQDGNVYFLWRVITSDEEVRSECSMKCSV